MQIHIKNIYTYIYISQRIMSLHILYIPCAPVSIYISFLQPSRELRTQVRGVINGQSLPF